MTAPHMRSAPDGSFTVGDGWQWGQNLNVELVDLLTMGNIIPTPNNVFDVAGDWLRRLPLPILTMMFRPLIPLSTDDDWVDVDTAVTTILNALPLSQIGKFFEWVTTVFDPFKALVDKLLDVLAGIVVNPGGVLQPIADFLHSFLSLAKWTQWLADLPALIIKIIKDLIGLDFSSIAAFITSLIAAIKKAVGLDFSSVQALFNSLSTLINNAINTAVKVVSDALKVVSDMIHGLVDGLWRLFTGSTGGVGKTVAEVIAAISGWLTNTIGKLIDGIANVFDPTGAIGHTVQDAIDAIAKILGVGQTAQASADHANIGVAAIKAEQAGGTADEFNYPSTALLPAPWSVVINSGDATQTGTYGPNGAGVVVWKPNGLGHRSFIYRRDDKPLAGVTGSITVVPSKAPIGLNSFMFICAQMSATDKSCVRVRIAERGVTFQTVNAAGTATNLAPEVMLPTLTKNGDVLELVLTATTMTLMRNNISVATHTYTPLAGRLVGFGADVSSTPFAWPAEFAGIAWHG